MVAARETTLQELLEGSKQYQVPLYQRTYSWTKPQLERLWEDITKLAQDRVEDPSVTHFIGSLVLAPSPANGPAGVQEFLVIDGQQRLTTLSILLCAIRDHRARTEGPDHRDRVNEQYLINRWKPEQHRLKVVPTQRDRAAYSACLDSTPQAGGDDPVGAAYRFFTAQLNVADDPDDLADIERIEDAVIAGLSVVSVTAQAGDNAHRIFESLNNTGLRLTQGDLLRNYLFMRLPTRGDTVYHSLWLPLQEALGKNLELLFWLDLVQRDPRIKQTDTYAGQQIRLNRLRTESEIEAEVARFSRLGALLATILDPATEPAPEVRHRLERLNQWGTTTVYPLLLHLLDRRAQGTATSAQVASAMLYAESFFVRRLLIGRATNGLNRILLPVVTEMSTDLAVDDAVRAYLSSGRKYYASDADVRTAARTIPFYLNGRPTQRSLVLRWLEQSYDSKEPVDVDSLTIEHVLPQTLNAAWEQVLGDDAELDEDVVQVHEALVHTLGNLTLTGYNSELSNSPFDLKREQLAVSGVRMNQEIAREARWGRPQIQARADAMADRIISLWPSPNANSAKVSTTSWDVMNQALAELRGGAWTTYGDVAALIGSHPVAVGARLAALPVPNAHHVLRADGSVSPDFHWLDSARLDDPQEVLRRDGVEFDGIHASPSQRMTTDDLAHLIGRDSDDLPEQRLAGTLDQDIGSRERFVRQITNAQGVEVQRAVESVMSSWVDLGGVLEFGSAPGETSCFLMSRPTGHQRGNIWPATLYPSGRFEIVFQYLRIRPPFDDPIARDEYRLRLNKIPGVEIAAAKVDVRPSFPLTVLSQVGARDAVVDILEWFHVQVGRLELS